MRAVLKSLAVIAVLVLAMGVASADCGAKDTQEGTLKAADAEKNVIVVVSADGAETKLTLTAETKVMNADGEKADVSKLVGTKVKVVSEHAKVDSIQQVA